MPIRCIEIPEPITLVEPTTKEPLKDEKGETKPVLFADFVSKLLFNPMWAENYKNIKSAKSIDKALKTENGSVQLAEEDWKKLKDLAENPKGGYGYHPAVMTQLLPFLEAIMEAKEQG